MHVNLANITIVLHQPRYPENIGAVARAAKNMGIRRLAVVQPLNCDLTRILKMATHGALDVVEDMEVYDELADALGPFQFIVGTTARTGSHRQTVKNPRRLAADLVSVSQDNQVALLFGPENRGLTNHELKFCHTLVTIPSGDFTSLNLAQAVMILAYEVFLASADTAPGFTPRLANRYELEGMYRHIQDILIEINFISADNPEYWLKSVRRFFDRAQLRARDVKAIRGVCRQLDWYFRRRPDAGSAESGLPGKRDAASDSERTATRS